MNLFYMLLMDLIKLFFIEHIFILPHILCKCIDIDDFLLLVLNILLILQILLILIILLLLQIILLLLQIILLIVLLYHQLVLLNLDLIIYCLFDFLHNSFLRWDPSLRLG